jgi:hypothetical protein
MGGLAAAQQDAKICICSMYGVFAIQKDDVLVFDRCCVADNVIILACSA